MILLKAVTYKVWEGLLWKLLYADDLILVSKNNVKIESLTRLQRFNCGFEKQRLHEVEVR